ncbi:ankyrin unc44 [Colletotrichum tofieldiae]|nr:ankyrin unc44 [Colletotrichum tofieldiae]
MGWRLDYDVMLTVVDSIQHVPTLSAIACTCRSLHRAVMPKLHRRALDHDETEIDNTDYATHESPYSIPLALWATTSQARPLLETILALRPAHLSARFRLPATTCRPHWPWDPALTVTVGYTTALHTAATIGDLAILRWLMRHCPSLRTAEAVDAPSRYTCQCPSRHLRVLQMFHVLYDPEESPLASPLHLALCHGHVNCARFLIQHGANWDRPLPGSRGVTGLMIIAANGLLPLLDWLLRERLLKVNDALVERDDMGLGALNYVAVCQNGWVAASIAKRLMRIGGQGLHGPSYAYRGATPSEADDSHADGLGTFDRDHEQILSYSEDVEACPVFAARCARNDDVLRELCRGDSSTCHQECILTADWQMDNGQR